MCTEFLSYPNNSVYIVRFTCFNSITSTKIRGASSLQRTFSAIIIYNLSHCSMLSIQELLISSFFLIKTHAVGAYAFFPIQCIATNSPMHFLCQYTIFIQQNLLYVLYTWPIGAFYMNMHWHRNQGA